MDIARHIQSHLWIAHQAAPRTFESGQVKEDEVQFDLSTQLQLQTGWETSQNHTKGHTSESVESFVAQDTDVPVGGFPQRSGLVKPDRWLTVSQNSSYQGP